MQLVLKIKVFKIPGSLFLCSWLSLYKLCIPGSASAKESWRFRESNWGPVKALERKTGLVASWSRVFPKKGFREELYLDAVQSWCFTLWKTSWNDLVLGCSHCYAWKRTPTSSNSVSPALHCRMERSANVSLGVGVEVGGCSQNAKQETRPDS